MSDEKKKKTKREYRWVTCFNINRGQDQVDGEDRLKTNKDKIINIGNKKGIE